MSSDKLTTQVEDMIKEQLAEQEGNVETLESDSIPAVEDQGAPQFNFADPSVTPGAEDASKQPPKKVGIITANTDDVEPNDYNPNEMPLETFNMLASDVHAIGLDQPIVVRPNHDKEGKYIIIDGEHRWRSAKSAGLKEIPIVVRDMSPEDARLTTVRRNMLRGHMNPEKFTKVVRSLVGHKNMSLDDIRRKMAFNVTKDFNKIYRGQTETAKEAAALVKKKQEESVDITSMAANLSQTVRDIMLNHGDTIMEGYIYFMYKGKRYMMLSMTVETRKLVEELIAIAHDEGVDINGVSEMMNGALQHIIDELSEM